MARKKALEAAGRPDAPKLRAVSIRYHDVLGLTEFGFAPGSVTELAGLNAQGKTSALRALEVLLGGGNLANLARIKEDGTAGEPEVVLVLAATDGSEAYRINRDANGVKVQMRLGDSPALKDLDMPPAAWLKSIWDRRGGNLVEFLQSKDPERILMILEAVNLSLDREALKGILGPLEAHVPTLPEGLTALDELKVIREAVFNARTGVNHSKKEKVYAAKQMRDSAPAAIPEDLKKQLADQNALISELATKVGTAEVEAMAAEGLTVEKAKAVAAEEISKLRQDHSELAASIRAAAEKRIAEALAETEVAVDAAETRLAKAVTEAKERKEAAFAGLEQQRLQLGEAKQAAARLQEQDRLAAKAKGLIEQAEKFEHEAVQLDEEAEAMTTCLTELDAYRLNLMKNLPIPGLEIDGKELRVDGILFDQQNEEKRYDVAIDVAMLRAGRLPLVLVDGAETFDQEHLDLLARKIEERGAQAIMTSVVRTAEKPMEVRDLSSKNLFGEPE